MMRSLFLYLKSANALPVAAFLPLAALVFSLFGVPAAASAYALTLLAAALLAVYTAGFLRFRRRRAALARAMSDVRECRAILPEPRDDIDAAYQALLREATEAWTRSLAQAEARYTERLADFTLWAHQVKTPLAAMRLMLGEEDGAQANALRAQLDSVERYVAQAMAYLRLDAPGTDYVLAPCALAPLVRASLRRFAPQFILKKLRLAAGPLDAQAVTDEKWLSFALEQLLMNAVQYTPQGGEVRVGVAPGPVLYVEDSGPGIDAQTLPRIFERGFTGETGHGAGRSSGLGLYLCKRAMDALGHPMRCLSAPGKGTRMEIDLAAKAAQAE